MRKNYGDLRLWLWTLIPLFNIAAFYLSTWRFEYLDTHVSLDFEGHTRDLFAEYTNRDTLLRQLDQFNMFTFWGMFVSLIAWSCLMRLENGKIFPGARRWHTALYQIGWAVNIVLLFTDPSGYIGRSFRD